MSRSVNEAKRWLLRDGGVLRSTIAGQLMSDLIDETESLRLTDAEQRALKDAADILEDLEDDDGNSLKPEAAALRGLLERHAKGGAE